MQVIGCNAMNETLNKFLFQDIMKNMFQDRLTPLYSLLKKKLDIRCTGLENIDPDKNYVFVMNHQSIADIPIAFSLLVPITNRKINLFLSHRFYDFFWPLALPLGVIRVSMDKKSKKAREYNRKQLEKGVKRLGSGGSVLVYPEGIIYGGLSNEILHAETGAIRLALRAKVPIIPIGTRNSNKAYPFLLKTKNPFVIKSGHPIHIKVGKEIDLDKYADLDLSRYSKSNKQVLRHLTDEIMTKVAKLSGLSQHFSD